MNDIEFMTHIVGEICEHAVSHCQEPNDTLEAVATNILDLLEVCNFNEWGKKEEEQGGRC